MQDPRSCKSHQQRSRSVSPTFLSPVWNDNKWSEKDRARAIVEILNPKSVRINGVFVRSENQKSLDTHITRIHEASLRTYGCSGSYRYKNSVDPIETSQL